MMVIFKMWTRFLVFVYFLAVVLFQSVNTYAISTSLPPQPTSISLTDPRIETSTVNNSGSQSANSKSISTTGQPFQPVSISPVDPHVETSTAKNSGIQSAILNAISTTGQPIQPMSFSPADPPVENSTAKNSGIQSASSNAISTTGQLIQPMSVPPTDPRVETSTADNAGIQSTNSMAISTTGQPIQPMAISPADPPVEISTTKNSAITSTQAQHVKVLTTTTKVPQTKVLVEDSSLPQPSREAMRKWRKSVHQNLNDPTVGYVWDLENALYGTFHTQVKIPHRNVRQILIISLLSLEPNEREKTKEKFRAAIMTKEPLLDIKEKIQERELKLLTMGIYANCMWAHPLPHPFDDSQCTVEELDLLLRRICIDKVFDGLPICPDSTENIPILT